MSQPSQQAAAQPVQVIVSAPREGAPAPADDTTPRRRRGARLVAADALHPSQRHWRRFGPTWGTLSASSGTLAAAMATNQGVPLPLLAAGTVAGALGSILSAAVQDMGGGRILWRGACWTLPGAWVVWSAATTPWGSWQLGSLAIGSLGAGWVAAAAEQRRKRRSKAAIAAEAEAIEAAARMLASAPEREWAARILRVCKIAVTDVRLERWANGAGYTIHMRLPDGGVGYQDIAQQAVRLGYDADLPVGCEVTARRGDTGRAVMLDISTAGDAIQQIHDLTDWSLRSVEDDMDVGVLRSNQPAMINLRYHCVAMAGQTDAGKSNQLQVINTQLARCVDAVIWHIDLTGGNLSRAWVRPWYQRECGHPIIDWVAANERQAGAMLDAALAIIDGRRSRYDSVMHAAGDDKLPVSGDIPEIVIVVDEIHRLPQHLRRRLVDISDTGRGAAVRTVACGLRAVDTYLPTAIVAQARVRIGMRVSDEKETAFLFGWRDRVDPNSMPYQGCGMLYQGDGGQASLVPFRGYRMAPPRIRDAALALADWRPPLDSMSAQIADGATRGAYTRRWADTLPLLFSDATGVADSPEGGVDVAEKPSKRTPAADEVDRIFGMGDAERAQLRDDTDAKRAAARAEADERRREREADKAAVELSLSECGITTADRLLALIDDAGPQGIATGELEHLAIEHMIGSRATVHRNLNQMLDKGLILRPPGRVVAARFAQPE